MLQALIIVALVFLVYWRTFKFHLIIDDRKWYSDIRKGTLKAGAWWKKLSKRFYGGGTLGTNIKVDHIFQTFLHAVVCVLIYFAFGANTISMWAAVLYAVNPANNQTAIWLNGRRYVINIIIVLLMIMAGPWGIILYPATGLFQVSAFCAPILYGWKFAILMPLFLALIWKTIIGKIKGRLTHLYNSDYRDFHPKKLIVVTKIYGAYILKMILPGRTMMLYPFLLNWGLTKEGNKDAYSLNPQFWFGVLISAGTIAAGVALWGDQKLFWMFAFMVLSTLQWCGFISVTQMFTDRYISLPNVFMMFFLTKAIFTFAEPFAYTILIALAAYYLTTLNVTMKMFKDIWAFYDYHIYWAPNNPKLREAKATRLLEEKDAVGAWEVIKEGLKLCSTDMKLNMQAAHCMKLFDDGEMAIHYLKMAHKHHYIGQEFMVKKFETVMFGMDLDAEMKRIENKECKFERPIRENIKKLHAKLRQNDNEEAKDGPAAKAA